MVLNNSPSALRNGLEHKFKGVQRLGESGQGNEENKPNVQKLPYLTVARVRYGGRLPYLTVARVRYDGHQKVDGGPLLPYGGN